MAPVLLSMIAVRAEAAQAAKVRMASRGGPNSFRRTPGPAGAHERLRSVP